MEKNFLKGVVLIVLAATAWGMGGVAGQYLFQYHQVDPIWLVMVRQVVAGSLFLLFCLLRRQNLFGLLKEYFWDIMSFSFIGILGAQLGFYYTISLCNAATATVVQYMAPLFVMMYMAWQSKRCPEGKELVSVVFALVGVFLISTHGSLDSLALSPLAIITGLYSALAYAFYSVQPVKMLKKYPTALVIGWGQLFSGVSLVLFRNPWQVAGAWDWHAVFAIGYLILGATVLSYALYLQGLKIVGPTKASLISCAEPLASIVAVVVLLDTTLTVPDLIGMGCIITTVLLLSLPKK